MALTTAQKNELATRLIEAQQTNNYGSFNDLVRQLRLTQADFLENFPAINQAGINEQIGRGAVVPTTAPPAVTYTTPQVTNAIRDALNAGFTVQQARQGAMTNFGLSSADFDKALQQLQSTTYNTTFSDARVAQAIQDSLAQGFTVDQARQGALANYGVTDAQFNRALASVSGGTQGMRGSAPLYQFPGLLAGREDMATGAQRFISRAPGSLLFDVPKVEGGQFTFTPGAFDYQAIREQQAGASKVDQAYLDQNQIQPGTSEYNRLTGKTTPQSSTTTTTTPTTTTTTTPVTTTTTTPTTTTIPTTTTTPSASSQYTDAQVAQAIKESMAQGFSLVDSMAGATRVYGVPVDQAYRAADSLLATKKDRSSADPTQQIGQSEQMMGVQASPSFEAIAYQPSVYEAPMVEQSVLQPGIYQSESIPSSPINEGLLATQETYPSSQIAQAIMDSLNQGFTMDQIQQGAFNNFGVDADQFSRAAAMLPSMGYSIGRGFQ